MHLFPRISAIALTVALATPALAQDAEQSPATGQASDSGEASLPDNAIVVTGERIRGQIETDVPPVVELDEADIAAYGADSLADLIEQLAPQTGSASGRGSGRPVFLVNGRRVSGFREFRRYPPEAIVRVQVFPEEVALQYGYPADQRVINFILKDNFSSREVELEYGQPTRGGRSNGEVEFSQLTINGGNRLLFGAEFNTSSLLTEAERDIIQTESNTPTVAGDPDPAEFRSLASDSESIELETTWNTTFGEGARVPSLSLNANLDRSFSRSLSGLDTVLLTDPDGNSQLRAIDDDPITRRTKSTTASLGSSFNAPIADWDLALTVDATRGWNTTRTDQRRDTTALVEAAAAGEIDIAGDLGLLPTGGIEQADSRTYTLDSLLTLTGRPILLPSGEVNVTATAGFNLDGIDSEDTRNPGVETSLDRRELLAGLNLAIPLASAREDFLAPLGELTLDLGGGVEDLSDFGLLTNWNAGLNWRPSDSLSLQASYGMREQAPGIAQLGNPQIVDVNQPVYDFATGETVLANVVTGGNPNLLAETQRDIKLAASYDFDLFDRSNFRVEYVRNRSDDVTESFPLLTPAIEAAFPDRVTRENGQLVELDRRAVTFAERGSSRIRYGFNFFGRVGSESEGGSRGRRGGMMARIASAARGSSSQGEGQGQGQTGSAPDRARFQQMREQFCSSEGQPDISQLPERMQQRLRGENGEVDPARVAEARERICSAEGARNREEMEAARIRLCTGWNAADPAASTPVDLAALPERVRERLAGPDGQVDPERLNQLRARVCAAPDGEGRPGGQDGDAGGAPPADNEARGSGGRSRGGGGGPGGPGGGQGRWNLSVYHTIELENYAVIADGIPQLDLLDGDALSGSGVSRHNVTMEGGLFHNGLGARLSANYASGSQVDDLSFHDLATFDLRLFMNLEQQQWLAGEDPGFLKGARLSLRVDNLFDAHQRVTDETGTVPLSYQPWLVDPLGRTFEIEFRKVF